MATTIVNISWSPVPGSYGTRVQYKEEGTSVWITPLSPTNPTLNTSYTLSLEMGRYYYIKLTTVSNQCNGGSIIKRIFVVTTSQCCPEGYTLSPDETYCYKIDEIAAIPPSGGTAQTAIASPNVAYSTCGTYIYDAGYSLDGTGTSTQIPVTNPFWVNGAGACANNNAIDGPLNRSGLWTSTASSGQSIGFSVCLNLSATKQYFIGIACDNYGKIIVDGVTIINQDQNALNTQYGGTGISFKVWHIYPVTLTAGPHIIEMIGVNDSSVAAFGAELYDNTAAEIESALSYNDLNVVFSTKDYIGQPIQLGSGGTGYTCPDNYSLASCQSPIICRRFLTASPIDCGAPSNTQVIYFGTKATGTTPSDVEILLGSSTIADGSLDVNLNWGIPNGVPKYYWLAIPALGANYLKNRWEESPLNKGEMGTPFDLFDAPAIVLVNGVNYYVWITNYATEFTQNNYKFSKV
jgi:hypothetical protein